MPKTREEWLRSAKTRRQAYRSGAKLNSVHWILVLQGDALPPEAICTGNEASGLNLYTARAWLEGGICLGKTGRHLRGQSAFLLLALLEELTLSRCGRYA